MLEVNINDVKKMFFNKRAVTTAVDRAAQRVMSKFGAFTRRTAKSSIKKARQKTFSEMTPKEMRAYRIRQAIGKREGFKVSRPKVPSRPGEPHRWRTGLVRKHIYFLYDRKNRSVIIGPARLSKSTNAPSVMEYGGTAEAPGGKRIKIDPRPTMQLAYAKEQPKLAQMWKDSVR